MAKINITFTELCERLEMLDELTLVETLNLSGKEIIDRCSDIIEENFDKIVNIVVEEEDDDE